MMLHARSDYDSIQPPDELGIPWDEPIILIRGQDKAAIPAAEAWCKAARELGASPEIINTVQRHIVRIRNWQDFRNAKVPDAPIEALRNE